MKRRLFAIIITILALVFAALSAMAAGTQSNYTDSDQNGICDNRNSASAIVDNNGNGICDNRKEIPPVKAPDTRPCKAGSNYTDSDEDGVCDSREEKTAEESQPCGNSSRNCDGEGAQTRQGKRHRRGA